MNISIGLTLFGILILFLPFRYQPIWTNSIPLSSSLTHLIQVGITQEDLTLARDTWFNLLSTHNKDYNVKKVTYKQALRFFGNANRMAKALGISRQAVGDWKEVIPELRQYQIRVLMDEG